MVMFQDLFSCMLAPKSFISTEKSPAEQAGIRLSLLFISFQRRAAEMKGDQSLLGEREVAERGIKSGNTSTKGAAEPHRSAADQPY